MRQRVAALLVLFGLLVGGCVERKPTVGVLLPLTSDDLSGWGNEAYEGFMLAVEDSGTEFQPIVQDTGGTVSGTIGAFEALVRQGATVVIGPIGTDAAKAAAVVARRHQVPFLTPSATGVEVTADNPFAFRFCYDDGDAAEALAAFARQTLDLKRIAVVVDLGTSYSVGLAGAFEEAFSRQRGVIVAEIGYWADDPSSADVLDRVAALDVDGALMAGYGGDVARMVRAASHERLGELVLLGGDGWDSDELREILPTKVRDAYHTSHFHVDDPREASVTPFVERYTAVHQVPPSDFAALMYDSTRAVLSVFDPSLDGVGMAKRLDSIREWPGVTGVISMNPEGNPTEKGIVLERVILGGPSRFVERTSR